MEAITKEANECMSERGKLESDKERFQELLQNRLQTMEVMAEKWNIELSVTQSQSQSVAASQDSTSILNISEGDMRAFMKALHQKQEALNEELKAHKERSVAAEDEIGKVLSDLHAREISFDSGMYTDEAFVLLTILYCSHVTIPQTRRRSCSRFGMHKRSSCHSSHKQVEAVPGRAM